MSVDADKIWAEKYAGRFAAAKAQERSTRDAVLWQYPVKIGFLSIRQMDMMDFQILEACGSPLLWKLKEGDLFGAAAIYQICLVLYPCRWMPGLLKRWHVFFGVLVMRKRRASEVLRQYSEETFIDAPNGSGGGSSPIKVGLCIHIVHKLANAYGWTEAEIFRRPLRRIFQYLKCIRLEKAEAVGGKVMPEVSGSTAAITAEHLQEVNALLAEEKGEKEKAIREGAES